LRLLGLRGLNVSFTLTKTPLKKRYRKAKQYSLTLLHKFLAYISTNSSNITSLTFNKLSQYPKHTLSHLKNFTQNMAPQPLIQKSYTSPLIDNSFVVDLSPMSPMLPTTMSKTHTKLFTTTTLQTNIYTPHIT